MSIEPGSHWRPASGWAPKDVVVEVEAVKGRMVYFKDATGKRHSGPYCLDIDNFLDGYEPKPDQDTETPSMFAEEASA